MAIEYYVNLLVNLVAWVAEVGAAVIILAGVLQALYRWAHHWRRGGLHYEDRISLGWSIVLGLEFLVAADVLTTTISPTWSRLGRLTVIILLRLLLSYFLEQEIERFERKQESSEA